MNHRGVFMLLSLVLGCRTAAPGRPAAATVTAADGVRIAYEARGRGELAVVLVHGWSCDRGYWDAQLAPLAERFRVVTVDLAGHGASGRERAAFTIESFGGDVAAVVSHLGLRRVVLVGHSMGGDVIVAAAQQLPGRVAGLIWIDTYKRLDHPTSPDELRAFVESFRADFRGRTGAFVRSMFPPTADRALVDRVADDMASAPPDVALSALESAFGYAAKVPAALDAMKLPVIAINPETPPSDLPSMQRHGVEVTTLSGVGHFMHLEDPARFNPLLIAAIEKLAR